MFADKSEFQSTEVVLFDRDGALVVDVPRDGDPDGVVLVDGAVQAVEIARAANLRLGVIGFQNGFRRRLTTTDQVEAFNERVDQLLGGFDSWMSCPHSVDDDCKCYKSMPQMVIESAKRLSVEPEQCVVIGTDFEAANAAGARSILVPNRATLRSKIARAQHVASTLPAAVKMVVSSK